jgi:hypothetical protein
MQYDAMNIQLPTNGHYKRINKALLRQLGRLPDAAGQLGGKGCLVESIILCPERYFWRWYFKESRLKNGSCATGTTAERTASLGFMVVLLVIVGRGYNSGCLFITVCTVATRHARHAEHKQT